MTLPKLFAEEDEPHLPPEKGVIVVLGVGSLFLGLFAPLMRRLTEGQVRVPTSSLPPYSSSVSRSSPQEVA